MKTFKQALLDGFDFVIMKRESGVVIPKGTIPYEKYIKSAINPSYFCFKFGDKKEYELCFEKLLFDNQWYVALYKNQNLLTEKVVVKPGKSNLEEER